MNLLLRNIFFSFLFSLARSEEEKLLFSFSKHGLNIFPEKHYPQCWREKSSILRGISKLFWLFSLQHPLLPLFVVNMRNWAILKENGNAKESGIHETIIWKLWKLGSRQTWNISVKYIIKFPMAWKNRSNLSFSRILNASVRSEMRIFYEKYWSFTKART